MKVLLPIAAAVLVAAAPVPAGHVRLQLDQLPVSELVTILYRDVLRVPYVVAPEVSTDRRTVSSMPRRSGPGRKCWRTCGRWA
jgi:general secretion pathway protein D